MKHVLLSLAVLFLPVAGDLWAAPPPSPAEQAQIYQAVQAAMRHQAWQDRAAQWQTRRTQRTAQRQQLDTARPSDQAAAYIASLGDAVTLSDDQTQQIQNIFQERDKALADFDAKNQAQIQANQAALDAARQSHDRAAIIQARLQSRPLDDQRTAILQDATDKLAKVLTPQQQAKIDDAAALAFIKSVTDPAKLTEDQITQLEAAWRGAQRWRPAGGAGLLPKILTLRQVAAINGVRHDGLHQTLLRQGRPHPGSTQAGASRQRPSRA